MKKYSYKLILVMSFFLITGFRGCQFLERIFSLVNYAVPECNSVTNFSLSMAYYYAANGGIIYIHHGDRNVPFLIDYVVPGEKEINLFIIPKKVLSIKFQI